MTGPDLLDATRASYDAVAADYAEHLRDELAHNIWARTFLAGFAEAVRAAGGGVVADVGCGPGRVTRHLHGLGLDAFGIDPSPGMLAQARRSHPDLRFTEGAMPDLDLPDGGLAGIVAWYSIIHVPDELLPATFTRFHRALAPGGHLALAFQVGDEPHHLAEALGHPVDLVFHRRRPDRVAALLAAAGLEVHAHLLRGPERFDGRLEKTPQVFLLARRPASSPDAPTGPAAPDRNRTGG